MSIFMREKAAFAPIVVKDRTPNQPGEFVSWISEKHRVAFVCSPHREDKRTGAIKYVKK